MLLEKLKGKNKMDKAFIALGTMNNIKVFNSCDEYIIDEIVARVFEIDDRMSAFKPASDISKISKSAGKEPQIIHRDTFDLIKRAVEFSSLSDGTFDITIRPLVELWGINKKGCYIPTDSEIQKALEFVNYKDIILDEQSCSVLLKNPGQSLDLGSIAKGYAADEAKKILESNHIKSALVNLGGNVVAVGKRPDGRSWQIGIQNPLASTCEYLGVITAVNKTVVTSGCNERFFMKDGVRYHHILDPHTGKPAQNSLLSVTAVCSDSAEADALTTALFILGPEKCMPLLKKLKAEAVFVTKDLSVYATCGLKNNLVLL